MDTSKDAIRFTKSGVAYTVENAARTPMAEELVNVLPCRICNNYPMVNILTSLPPWYQIQCPICHEAIKTQMHHRYEDAEREWNDMQTMK